jgi:tricorn protease-like protein
MKTFSFLLTLLTFNAFIFSSFAQQKGYYRFPSVHNNLVVFTAEGDLWK